ncbi:MAG TPA: class I SAM-dependent methyltransferase [Thermoleophilaceae bacterium]|nr:class I SAM-dependent methyltransferase [Thermoleophilaceae bacterium]
MADFAEELKARTRDAWSLGDYTPLARMTFPASEALADACAISAGQEVLDVAAGNGNLALVAAREGAAVVASDLTPAMVELGRDRLAEEGYDVDWQVADVEALPFEDGRFDCCASVFGAMLAPRPEVAAAEMFRVVRPGGTVGLTAWTADGFQGRVFALGNKYVPGPEGVPASSDWAEEEVARERLGPLASSVSFSRHSIRLAWDSTDGFFEFSRNAGPTVARTRAMSDEDRVAMKRDVLALIEEFNQASDGSVAIDAEYAVVVARKRG